MTTMTPKNFIYVGTLRCGHINFLAVEPHADDVEERASLVDDLRYFFESGGWVERVPRDASADLTLCFCECGA